MEISVVRLVFRCIVAVVALIATDVQADNAVSPTDSLHIEITGARRVSEARIRSFVMQSDGLSRIADEYARLGYWNAVITDSIDIDTRTRYITIREGAPVSIEPDSLPGRIGSPNNVAVWAEDVLKREANRGHPFGKLDLVSATESSAGAVVLDARLDRGSAVTVTGVAPRGNTVTRDEVIVRELRRPSDWIYSQDAVNQWRRRLRRTGYFDSVSEPYLVWSDSSRGLAELGVQVSEGRPNRFEGVVGYQPADGTGAVSAKGYFTGLVDLVLGNLWGSGRRLSARWERPVKETTTLELMYREPWIAGYPVDTEGRLFVDQRPGYASEELRVYIGGELWSDFSVGGSVGREIVRSDSIALLGGPRFRGWLVSSEIEYDTRDDVLNPTSGIRYRFGWETSFRRNRIYDVDFVNRFGADSWPETERTSTVRVNLTHLVGLGGVGLGDRLILAIGWNGAQTTSNEGATLSASDQIRVGGVTTVRGYYEEHFSGDLAVWGRHELRYLLAPASRAFVFVDAGAIRNRYRDIQGDVVETTAWPIGYGVGMRARTAAGVLGIDFGWGRGDSFGHGKVHVRLETIF